MLSSLIIKKKRTLVESKDAVEEKKVQVQVQAQPIVLLPPGAVLLPNFVTEEEERALIAEINLHKWSPLMKREVQHYGAKYKYRVAGEVEEPIEPIPKPIMQMLLPRIQRAGYFLGSTVDDAYVHSPNSADDDEKTFAGERMQEMIANKYQPGVGIGKHVDDKEQFGPTIISLSLLDEYVMDFEKVSKVPSSTDGKLSVLLPRRSLLVLTGPARESWYHSIAPRKNDDDSKITQPTPPTPVARYRHARKVRISLTFRSLNKLKSQSKKRKI